MSRYINNNPNNKGPKKPNPSSNQYNINNPMQHNNNNYPNNYQQMNPQNHNMQNKITGGNPGQMNNNMNNNFQPNQMGSKLIDHDIKCYGEIPHPRFGHSICMINNAKMVLFGGAVGNTKKIQYSNETFTFNLMTKLWNKIEFPPNSYLPKPRAAHAAACNDQNQMIIHGGSCENNELASDELWMFDMHTNSEKESSWRFIKTDGKTPGLRYGHTLAFMKPYFVLVGGNSNTNITNDVWIIDLNFTQAIWTQLTFSDGNTPSPRLYHTSGFTESGSAKGMLIIFGGRDQQDNPLNDIWGLRRHRDGRWDWVNAPIAIGQNLQYRYNHSVVFVESLMIIIGGRSKGHHGALPIEVYDTEKSESFILDSVGIHRHSSFIFEKNIYLFGGFLDSNQHIPLDFIGTIKLSTIFRNTPSLLNWISNDNNNSNYYNNSGNNIQNNNNMINNSNVSEMTSNFPENNNNKDINNKSTFNNKNNTNNKNIINNKNNPDSKNKQVSKKKFKLSNDVVVGAGGAANLNNSEANNNEQEDDSSNLFRKVPIDKLTEENKRIGEANNTQINQLMMSRRSFNFDLINNMIEVLLRPFDWYDEEKMKEVHDPFPFNKDKIFALLEEIKPVIVKENSLIRIRSPCKIFGNLYGQYNDLMRFFESFGNPSDDNQNGDITVMQYIFLGDFCDRGQYNLEVILLLFALKVKYPDFIYIIRGHHEDKNINTDNGLGQECKERLNDNITNSNSVFAQINKIFELLPFGILIDNNILCIHGGIGSSIKSLSDIENIPRPFEVKQIVNSLAEQNVLDILWSEYDDTIDDIINSERDKENYGFIVKYGKKKLDEFLSNNKLSLLITSHQYVQDGFTTFNDDKLLTVYSATNYMDQFNNYGGMITIAKKTANKPNNIIPRLINAHETGKKNYRSGNYSPAKNKK